MLTDQPKQTASAWLIALTLAASLIAAGCGGDDDDSGASGSAEGVFVGTVEGSDAYVAVVSDGDQVVGYLCDGSAVSTWLGRSPVEDGKAALLTREGERIGEVILRSDGASGEVTIEGEASAFSASLARGGTGLYRQVTGSPNQAGHRETGWIVLAGGSTRGSTNFIDQEGDLATGPAPKRTVAASQVTPGFIDQESEL